jgi:uncharacterized protein YciI
MKHFIVDITYAASAERIAEIRPDHRVFLQRGYEQGLLLCSGPQAPKAGGLVVARADSLAALQSFFADDPYQRNGAATYTFTEFDPVMRQDFLESWVMGS